MLRGKQVPRQAVQLTELELDALLRALPANPPKEFNASAKDALARAKEKLVNSQSLFVANHSNLGVQDKEAWQK